MEPIIRPRLGLALRHLMLDKGVTARDLSRSLGIGETRLSRMLRGELEVSPSFAETMLLALHRRHLIAGAGDSPPPPTSANEPMNAAQLGRTSAPLTGRPFADWLSLVISPAIEAVRHARDVLEIQRRRPDVRTTWRKGVGLGATFDDTHAVFVPKTVNGREGAIIVVEIKPDMLHDDDALEKLVGPWIAYAPNADLVAVSRIDIAIDYLIPVRACLPLALGPMSWNVHGRAGRVESITLGSRQSCERVVVYDRLRKLKAKRRPVPDGVEALTRVEAQVRRTGLRLRALPDIANPFDDLNWFDLRNVPSDPNYGALAREALLLGLRGVVGQLGQRERPKFLAALKAADFGAPEIHPRIVFDAYWREAASVLVGRIARLIPGGAA